MTDLAANNQLTHEDALEALAKVRDENAKRRQELAPYKEAFDGLTPQQAQFLLGTIAKLKQGDGQEGVVEWLHIGRQMADPDQFDAWINDIRGDAAIMTDTTPSPQPEQQQPEPSVPVPANLEQVVNDAVSKALGQYQQTTQQQQMQQRAVALQTQAEQMGFTHGTPQYKALFQMAIDNKVPLEKAKELYEETFGAVQSTSEEPAAEQATQADEAPPMPRTTNVDARTAITDLEVPNDATAEDKLRELIHATPGQ